MENSVKRIQYHKLGGPEEMRLEMFQLSDPGKGEILVRVKAASINPFDWKLRNGYMKFMIRSKFPRAMGADFSGIVEAIGDGVTEFRVGDKVMGTVPLPGGTLAEKLITKEKLVMKKPEELSYEAAAALPIVGVTAWNALVGAGKLKNGQSIFINGALGGIGQSATYIAKAMGATVAGRVGPTSLNAAKAIGIEPSLDYTKEIPKNLHGKFDIVFDVYGSMSIAEGDALLKRGGVVIDAIPTTNKFMKGLVSSRRKVLMSTPSLDVLRQVVDLAIAGKLPLSIGRTVSLNEAIPLIKELESGRSVKGKVVVVMS
jgi:NADPH:quinone reductase-like Zn-dependent oxidoreductase